MLGGEVLVAGGAAVCVGLGVVDFEVGEGGEGEGGVGGEGAFHRGSRRIGGGRGVQIFGGMGVAVVSRRARRRRDGGW